MYDSPWKAAIEAYFPDFLAIFFPEAHDNIDWKRGYSFLDKELQQLGPASKLGRRAVDKLVRVWRGDGTDAWVLIHVEIQAQAEKTFAERMFVYHYRIFDRYDRHVVSLAVLADERPGWRPSGFGYALWGCRLQLDFPAVKLLDFEARWQELVRSRNPFAVLVQAHLKTQATRQDPNARLRWKLAVVKGLYETGSGREEIVQLFRFIDWLMQLPAELDQQFEVELAEFEEEKSMPYVTSIERIGIKKGRDEGLKVGREEGLNEGRLQMARASVLDALEIRFGAVPDTTRKTLDEIADTDLLRALLKRAIEAASIAAFEHHLDESRKNDINEGS